MTKLLLLLVSLTSTAFAGTPFLYHSAPPKGTLALQCVSPSSGGQLHVTTFSWSLYSATDTDGQFVILYDGNNTASVFWQDLLAINPPTKSSDRVLVNLPTPNLEIVFPINHAACVAFTRATTNEFQTVQIGGYTTP